jgi:dolichyl-phosphate beta-glucosyltransferase
MKIMGSNQEIRTPLLSVVIPAFNQGPEIRLFLENVRDYLDTQEFQSEILVVDDASTDATYEFISEFKAIQSFRIFKNSSNHGKGYSVKKGVMASRGTYILVVDADSAYNISSLNNFLTPLRKGKCDIALGNRRMSHSRFVLRPKYLPYIYVRHLTGVMFNLIARTIVLPGFMDTQCGYKCFSRNAALDIFKRLRITGFCFDVEALSLAVKLGYRCLDVPVTFYYYGEPSSIRVFPHALHFLRDLVLIRRNMILGVYDV